MRDRVFLDTNVFIYMYSLDEPAKREAACNLSVLHVCVTSTQALNESCNIWFKKFRLGKQETLALLLEITSICDDILLIRQETIARAISIKDEYHYSYYDCLMLASAMEGNCGVIFTEDMRDGQVIHNRLTIVNPFKKVMP